MSFSGKPDDYFQGGYRFPGTIKVRSTKLVFEKVGDINATYPYMCAYNLFMEIGGIWKMVI